MNHAISTLKAAASGRLQLNWGEVQNAAGYNIYRATAPITEIATAEKLNGAELHSDTDYLDIPAEDGTYYYTVTAQNELGTEGAAADSVSGTADATPPRAESITYTSDGNSIDNRYAPGNMEVILTVSEKLLTKPFLTITPEGGVPFALNLIQIGEKQYKGSFTITDKTPSGDAYAVFSARDKIGNRGTDIESGGIITIDTAGPAISELTIAPAHPVKNDSNQPAQITATIKLDQQLGNGEELQLHYLLSGAGRTATAINSITMNDPHNYSAVFDLPADAGELNAETLSFTFSAKDDLGNSGTTINGRNSYQIYQGDLPPLDAPQGITATAQANGKIQLTWNKVEEASAYIIYRKAPGESEYSELTSVDADSETPAYIDQTQADGEYGYRLTTLRSENAQEAESGMSAEIHITADATPPQPPQCNGLIEPDT